MRYPATRLIPLNRTPEMVIVDEDDYGWLSQSAWYLSGAGYATRQFDGERVYMHKLIKNALPNFKVDHIDGNKLNNTKRNLRICTHSQNGGNRRLNKNSSTGYKGVQRRGRAWVATIGGGGTKENGGVAIRLGRFDTPEAAAFAYDEAAIRKFGSFARLNFPELKSMLSLHSIRHLNK